MFCALEDSFIFLFALTNVIKHYWSRCWGLGFCLSLVIALRNANKHFCRRCQGLGFLSIFGDCIKKCQHSLGEIPSFILKIYLQWIGFLFLGNFTKSQVPFFSSDSTATCIAATQLLQSIEVIATE